MHSEPMVTSGPLSSKAFSGVLETATPMYDLWSLLRRAE